VDTDRADDGPDTDTDTDTDLPPRKSAARADGDDCWGIGTRAPAGRGSVGASAKSASGNACRGRISFMVSERVLLTATKMRQGGGEKGMR